MTWRRRRPWSFETLASVGTLSGLVFLFLCLKDPLLNAVHAAPGRAFTSPHGSSSTGESLPTDLLFPVPAVPTSAMADSFNDPRGLRVHHAVDILAPRRSEVRAVADGTVARMMSSVAGGIAVYQWSADKGLVYYYAHLDGYAPGLEEGQKVTRGQLLGYVGTTGNAPPQTPHLHFAISRTDKTDRWWGGTPVNPFPIWR